MEDVTVVIERDKIIVGEYPKLIIDLKTQENYILAFDRKIPYRQVIRLSPDLIAGKRERVFQTAVNYYYRKACEAAEGVIAADEYRKKANTTARMSIKNL